MVPKPGGGGAAYDEHLARLHTIVMQWQAGDISLSEKRRQMASENDAYYRAPTKGDHGQDLTDVPNVPDEAVLRLADASRIPLEAAAAAMSALRRAGWDAEHADSVASARAILAAGREAYEDIMRTAR